MKKVLRFLSFSLMLALLSCGSDNRHKITGGELTVYFLEKSDEKIAEKVAFFWRENNLLSGEPQDLQVKQEEGKYVVSMIANEPKKIKQMPFDEVQLLSQLKKKMYVEIFDQEAFTLEICNNRFETVYTVE